MKKSSIFVWLAVLVAMASLASAVPACDAGASTVIGLTCIEGGITFSNFTVSPSAGLSAATVGLAAGPPPGGTGVVGSDVDLVFQFGGLSWTGPVGYGDILLTYAVSYAQGVDLAVQGTPVGSPGQITITEIVCTQAFSGSNCNGTTLANYAVTSTNGSSASGFSNFTGTSNIFIKKDIQFNGATTSEITNSQLVPEPMTLSLMGLGLLGLGIAGRRFRK
jgi:hypothetical protein